MRDAFRMVFLVFSLSAINCNLPTSPDDPNLVTGLHFTPSAFDSFRRNTEMKYSLKSASTVNAYIVKRDSTQEEFLVKTLVEGLAETKGSHAITWIGDTEHRLFAPAGIYFGVIEIHDRRFQTIVQIFHF